MDYYDGQYMMVQPCQLWPLELCSNPIPGSSNKMKTYLHDSWFLPALCQSPGKQKKGNHGSIFSHKVEKKRVEHISICNIAQKKTNGSKWWTQVPKKKKKQKKVLEIVLNPLYFFKNVK